MDCEVQLTPLVEDARKPPGRPPGDWKGENRERKFESQYACVSGTLGGRLWTGVLVRNGKIFERIKPMHTGEQCWVRRFEYFDSLTLKSGDSEPRHFESGAAVFDLEGYGETPWIDESKLFTTHQVAQNLQQFLSALESDA